MRGEIIKKNSSRSGIYKAFSALLLSFLLAAAAAYGQTVDDLQTTKTALTAGEQSAAKVVAPVLTNYREIKIGMTAEDVRDKLGKPKMNDKDGFYYEFSDDETMQIGLDENRKTRYIIVFYSGKNENAPKLTDVFGKDAAVEPSADGKIHKLVQYPEAGYWVSYSRAAGENPAVTIMMQKMP